MKAVSITATFPGGMTAILFKKLIGNNRQSATM